MMNSTTSPRPPVRSAARSMDGSAVKTTSPARKPSRLVVDRLPLLSLSSPWTDFVNQGRAVIDIEAKALKEVQSHLDRNFAEAILLLKKTIEAGNKIIVTGVGKSGQIGAKIAATLSSTGAPSLVLDTVNASHGDLGVIVNGDIVLILSYSGETEEVVRLLPSLKRIGTRIISLTGNPKSSIAQESELHINVHVSREACPLNLAPTSSSTAMLATGDALAMVLLQARGFRKEDFATYHPGGSLGRNLLLKVTDIMRSVEQMAILPGTATVNEALHLWARPRSSGAAAIINHKGRLVGIYTHGDFVRGYQSNMSIGSAALATVMTKNPIRIKLDRLAVEAFNILEANPIDDLIVVNHLDQPVGLIDAQDLAKHKLL